jgi:MFS family permease
VAPYLGVVLKSVDPRLPFALSSLTLLAATAGIVHVERRLKLQPPAPAAATPAAPQVVGRSWPFLLALLLLAVGFQVHFSINAAPQFLRFAPPAELEWLMPVFWVGFGVAMMPGSALCKRYGVLPVMAVSAALGAVAAWAALHAPTLELLIAAQLVAGGAWGNMMMCGFTAAVAAGRSGREGLALGLLFSVLAAATLARIAATAAGLPKLPGYAEFFVQAPVALWLAGAIWLFILALRTRRAVVPHPA